jgi:hypothetical protein
MFEVKSARIEFEHTTLVVSSALVVIVKYDISKNVSIMINFFLIFVPPF